MKKQRLISCIVVGIFILAIQFNAMASKLDHPHYLHALSDLRVARWMIEHRPGNWQTTIDEVNAVNRIDAAIFEIKKASIDDGKDVCDHISVDEHPDHAGRLHDAIDFLRRAQQDINMEEDNRFADGLRDRALTHINEAIRLTINAIAGSQTAPPPPPPLPTPSAHPFYLHALTDLRIARWEIQNRPGNWQTTVDEVEAVNRIDAAINELKRAAIDDGKDINDHVGADEHSDHAGRLQSAIDFLRKAQQDVNHEEDNNFASGLQGRALMHINESIRLTFQAMGSLQRPSPGHPAYMHALSDLRVARWMIEHRPGNWEATIDEVNAVNRIDAAINEIKRAAINDGKDVNEHVYVDEHPDHMGRLHDAIDFLEKARQDISRDEDNRFADGLQARAIDHISEAIRLTRNAIHQ
jgi:tetratricopeptide (TPR) repeat protein